MIEALNPIDAIGFTSMLVGFISLGLCDLLRGHRRARIFFAWLTVVSIVVGIVGMAIAWLRPF